MSSSQPFLSNEEMSCLTLSASLAALLRDHLGLLLAEPLVVVRQVVVSVLLGVGAK